MARTLGEDKRGNFVYTMNVAEELGLFGTKRDAAIDSIIADIQSLQEDNHYITKDVIDAVAEEYGIYLRKHEWDAICRECHIWL